MIGRILLVARNTFRAVMSQRALFVWGFAIVIMFLRSAPAIFAQNRTPELLAFLRANSVSGAIDLWSYLCMMAAGYIGATSIPSDLRTKTIITVLARPIHRWELLTGKWVGVTAFCMLTLAIGVVLALGLAAYLDVNVEADVLRIAAARTIAGIVLFGAVAIAVSTGGSAPIAASFAMLLAILPVLIGMLRDDPDPTYHRVGVALDALVAPNYQSHYMGVVWAPFPVPPNMRGRAPAQLQQRPVIDYPKQQREIAETAGYSAIYFVLGCLFFARRDLSFS